MAGVVEQGPGQAHEAHGRYAPTGCSREVRPLSGSNGTTGIIPSTAGCRGVLVQRAVDAGIREVATCYARDY